MDEAKVPFPTFVTGLQELFIVDAILKIFAKWGQWVDVKYHRSDETGYR